MRRPFIIKVCMCFLLVGLSWASYSQCQPSLGSTGAGPCTWAIYATFNGSNYQWYRNGSVMTGQTSSSITVSEGGSYHLTALVSGCSSPQPSSPIVIPNTPVASITPAGNTWLCTATGSVSLSTPTGTGYSYQWRIGSSNISGATASTYVATQAGSYTVQVSNSACAKISPPVQITMQELNATVTPAGPIAICSGVYTLSTTTGYSYYNWYKDGTPISGANSPTYNVTSTGSYKVFMVNGPCTKYSDPVQVTIGAPPAPTIVTTYPEVCLNSTRRFKLAKDNATTSNLTWSSNSGYQVTLVSGTNGQEADITFTSPGSYVISVTPVAPGLPPDCGSSVRNLPVFVPSEAAKKDSVIFTHSKLGASSPVARKLFLNRCEEINGDCPKVLKKLQIFARFDLGEIYKWGKNQNFSGAVSVALKGLRADGSTIFTKTSPLKINTLAPEQVYYYVEENNSNLQPLREIEVSVSGYTFTNPLKTSDIRLLVSYEETNEVNIRAARLTINADPVINGWDARLSWNVINPLYCQGIQNYEVQVMRIFGSVGSLTEKEWKSSLTIETASPATVLQLALAEGTASSAFTGSGRYVWRVRAIGTLPGGVTNPDNWGQWSSVDDFEFNQPEEDKNWIFSRTFTEGNRVSEQLTYANGLQQVSQQQTRLQSIGPDANGNSQQLIVTQTMRDFVGRNALSTLPVPVKGENKFGYRSQLLKKKKGGTTALYTTAHFDENPYSQGAFAAVEGDYYSGTDITQDGKIFNDRVPSADSVPYTRTIFTNDGSGKVKEQAGAGLKNSLYGQRTIKTFYTGVGDGELVRLFGDESPASGSVQKIINVDGNNTASISYQNKDGKLLATALSVGQNDANLLPLSSRTTVTINEEVTGRAMNGPYEISTKKPLLFTVGGNTTVTINYEITPAAIEALCNNACSTCDYTIDIILRNPEPIGAETAETILRTITIPGGGNCSTIAKTIAPVTTTSVRSFVNYVLEKRVRVNNKVITGSLTKLDDYVNKAVTQYENNLSTALATIKNHLDNKQLKELYDYLNANPSQFPYDAARQEYKVTLTTGNNCTESIFIPKEDLCPNPIAVGCLMDGLGYAEYFINYWAGKPYVTLSNGKLQFVYYTAKPSGTKLLFTAVEFNTMLSNLLRDNPLLGNCQNIWDIWVSEVEAFDSYQSPPTGASLTGSVGDNSFTFENNLLERFFRRIEEHLFSKNTINPGALDVCSYNNTYYIKKDKPYGATFSGAVSPNIQEIYRYFYIDSNNAGVVSEHSRLLATAGVATFDAMPDCWKYKYSREMDAGEFSNSNPQAVMDKRRQEAINKCGEVCEMRREEFRQALINRIFTQNPAAKIERYRVTFSQEWGVYRAEFDATYNITGGTTYSKCQLDDMVTALVNNCKNTYCQLSYVRNASNNIISLGTVAEQEKVKKVLNNTFEIQVGGTCTGWDTIDPTLLPQQTTGLVSAQARMAASAEEKTIMNAPSYGPITNTAPVFDAASLSDSEWQKEAQILGISVSQLKSRLSQSSSARVAQLSACTGSCLTCIDPNPTVVNVNFETGNFTGWTGSLGSYSDPWGSCNLGFGTTGNPRHKIVTSSDGTDLIGGFPVVAPGGSFSVRLGNNSVGAQAEQLVQKFVVNQSTSLFSYNIAVVLEDPGHSTGNPYFEVKFFDQTGTIIPCSDYKVIAGKNIPGFVYLDQGNNTGITYRPWTTNTVDLTKYVGQEVTVVFTTSDCAPTAHYGYAYVDGTSLQNFEQIQITGDDLCKGNSLNFTCDATGNYPNERYTWFFGDGSMSDGRSPYHEYESGGVFEVQLIIDLDPIPGFTCNQRIFRRQVTIANCEPCPFTPFCFRFAGVRPDTPSDLNAYNPVIIQCGDVKINNVVSSIDAQVAGLVKNKREQFTQNYLKACADPAKLNDKLTLSYNLGLHHFTLYYYDRAGNLIRTVAPRGVVPLTQALATARTTATNHGFVTKYQYNSLGQLIRQHTPDGNWDAANPTAYAEPLYTATESEKNAAKYYANFFYNDKAMQRFSQNAKQKVDNTFSYTKYDELGRVIEVGLASGYNEANLLANRNNNAFPSTACTEITRTIYTSSYRNDFPLSDPKNIALPGDPATGTEYQQRFLRNRVSYTYTDEDGNNTTYGDRTITIYSYDPHGNVEWMIQGLPGLYTAGQLGFLALRYDYDLLRGNVTQVSYNPGNTDQFYHKYQYDADKRIKAVYTSRNGVIWDKDAQYEYFPHGPLKRLVLGEDGVQGIDYTYTIQNWLKAINHPYVNLDPGMDGGQNTASDAFSMALTYFSGDYNRTGSPFNSTHPSHLPALANRDLYNGNISAWTSNISAPTSATSQKYQGLSGYVFEYDELNRLRNSYFRSHNGTAYVSTNEYQSQFTYDANGNILTASNNGPTGANFALDNLSYYYYVNNNATPRAEIGNTTSVNSPYLTNRLSGVLDAAPISPYDSDVEPGQSFENNYEYDAIGNLVKDRKQSVDITWNMYGKVRSTSKDGTSYNFKYDANGNRVLKKYANAAGLVRTSFYMRDASGNTMAEYERIEQAGNTEVIVAERSLYGVDRLGLDIKTVPVTAPLGGGAILDPGEQRITTTTQKDAYENLSYLVNGGATLSLVPGFKFKSQGAITNFGVRYGSTGVAPIATGVYTRDLNAKLFELKDHLGNIRSVVSDQREAVTIANEVPQGYKPDMAAYYNYYPFGMDHPGRTWSSGIKYRYGFNGKEKDSNGEWGTTSYDYGFRIYNPALGKFLSVDPLANSFPWNSPYSYSENRVIDSKDMDGLERYHYSYDLIDGNYQLANFATEHMDQEGLIGAIAYKKFGMDYKESHLLHYEGSMYEFSNVSEMQSFDPENPGDKMDLVPLMEMNETLDQINQVLEEIADARGNSKSRTRRLPGPKIKTPTKNQVRAKTEANAKVATNQKITKSIKPSTAGAKAITKTNSTKGWKVGDPINNQTFKGQTPSWDAVRARYWKNRAHHANKGEFSNENIKLMKAGRPPQRTNPKTGKVESMELHHDPPQRDGGLYDVQELWPSEHEQVDPYRKTGGG